MAGGNTVRVAVLPGDGIGPEVTEATLAVLEPLAKRHGLGLSAETLPAGAFHFRDTGEALPEDTFRRAEAAEELAAAGNLDTLGTDDPNWLKRARDIVGPEGARAAVDSVGGEAAVGLLLAFLLSA